jgi:hypothetical protein
MNHTIKTLAANVRKTMLDHIQSASNADLFAIASSLFANAEPAPLSPGDVVTAELPIAKPRFTLYDLRGNVVQSGGVAVYDAQQNLTFTKAPLECGAVNWKDAMKACAEFRLFGKDDWRSQSVKDRVYINDYTKFGPALYSEFDAGSASHEWNSDVDAEDPSGCAWIVCLRNGDVYRYGQAVHGSVRAVRVGQPLSLGI